MKKYCVKTYKTEDTEEMICEYDYSQYIEVVAMLNKANKHYKTWVEEIVY